MTLSTDKYDFLEYVIGIDPGTDTGVAIKNLHTGEIEDLYSMKIHNALQFISTYLDQSLIVVEDARLWNGHRKGMTSKEFNAKKQGSGSVKRDSAIWADFLEDEEAFYVLVSPAMKGRKLSHSEFKQFTGWNSGTTNQHKRDAGMLTYPYTFPVVAALYEDQNNQ